MKRLLSVLFFASILACNSTDPENPEDPPGGGGQQGSQHYPVNFDSTYHLCLGRDTLAVRITDTTGGIVTYITLPDSTQQQKSASEFINAVEACFPE